MNLAMGDMVLGFALPGKGVFKILNYPMLMPSPLIVIMKIGRRERKDGGKEKRKERDNSMYLELFVFLTKEDTCI